MNGKVLTKETKVQIVKVLDDAIKLPFYIEPFDAIALNTLLNLVDRYADKVVPDELDANLNAAIQLALGGEEEKAIEMVVSIANALVDIPLLDEDTEQEIGINAMKLIISFVKDWITKRRGE